MSHSFRYDEITLKLLTYKYVKQIYLQQSPSSFRPQLLITMYLLIVIPLKMTTKEEDYVDD